ncbi:MAG TPA: right-handed parallel beta-helix repeat-containing protein [Planctomycetes bacterium]|nr:right-handed parallel beta-helix repeat-containing protein [Planctomycetota bacterium]
MLFSLMTCLLLQGGGVDLFVSPTGTERAQGTAKDPLALQAAIQRLRELRRGGLDRTIRIRLAPGDYFLSGGLVLDRDCSGTKQGPSILQGKGARLLGAIPLPLSWIHKERGLSVIDLSKARLSPSTRGALTLRPRGMGRPARPVAAELLDPLGPMRRARWPDQGFVHFRRVLDPGSVPRNRMRDTPASRRETGPPRGGVFAFAHPRLAQWAKERQAWAFGFWHWDWADELLPIARIDPEAGTIHLGLPHRYGLRKGGAFYLVNLLSELDRPGEFYIDPEGQKLFFLPRTESKGPLLLSLLAEPLIRIRGGRDIHIEGLRLEAVRGDALCIEGGRRNRVLSCLIQNTGLSGIKIQGEENLVQDCLLENIGASGIELAGGDRATLRPGANAVIGCEIRRFGRLFRSYQPAIRLHDVGQIVRNNLLHHGPHSALIFDGNEHRIEKNEIHHVLLETGDCGAIYTGRDWTLHGTLIRWNFIHDLPGTSRRWQNGVYLDDMASGIRVEGNVFFRCNSGMLVGGGRDNIVAYNLFIDSKLGIRFDQRGVKWMAGKLKDPRTSTLHRRLRAVPIDREPWKSRYPSLQRYLSDRMGKPVGSKVLGNLFFGTRLGTIADPKTVEVRGNLVKKGRPGILEERSGRGPRFKVPSFAPEGVDGFPPIPLSEIGRGEVGGK